MVIFGEVIRVKIAKGGTVVRVYVDHDCVLRVVGKRLELEDEREWQDVPLESLSRRKERSRMETIARVTDLPDGTPALDLTGAEHVQVQVRADGRVVWVNTEHGCVLRICRVGAVEIVDDR